ncbi:MAG TPA: 50S ribosomal protein L4 [Gammaproteobacteria bacterium]|nr:50S ribosomal protein L4 [Gammaproteobacteria bacterium]
MELQLINSSKTVKLPASIFNCDFKEALIHQAVTSYLSGGRSGTHAQKTRAEVRGGGIKPWRQKGTGRARAGTIRSPLWRKGGVIFAAKPRSYKQKMNKKAYRLALCSILSELTRQDRFAVVESLSVETHKTKDFLKTLGTLLKDSLKKGLDLNQANILIVTDKLDENLLRASRNLPGIELREPQNLNPVVLVNAEKVIITKAALTNIEEWLK